MSHVHEGPLATYNSLLDPHLAGYYSNTHIRKHLRKSKLITKKGEVITESKYRLLNARANHRKQVREMLAQAIVHKTLDMERRRQAEIRHRLDKIAKIEMVKRVRAERKFGYEDTIMDLLRPPSEVRRRRRNSGKSTDSFPLLTGSSRSSRTATSQRRTYSAQDRRRDEEIDSRGHPYIRGDKGRGQARQSSAKYSYESRSRSESRDRSRSKSGDRRDKRRGSDSSLSTFDSESSESHREGRHLTPHRASSRAEGSPNRSKSPYREDGDAQPPMVWKPHPPAKKPPANTPRDEHGRPIKAKKQVRGRMILHRQEPAFKHEKDVQTFCEVTLKYLGGTYSHQIQQQIIVEQQHCGGNTLTVFKEYVKPKSNFIFTSKRHRGFPFGLTLYIDGHQDATVSTCCEYKHRKGVLLGSKSSHFLFVSVEGAQPCYKCQVEAELSSKAKSDKEKREERKKAKEDAEKKEEEQDYDEDFEASDAEKDDYEDDFDDGDKDQSEHSARSPAQSSRRSRSKSPGNSDGEDKTAREVKGYDDELEVRSSRSGSKSPSSSRRGSDKRHKKSGSSSSQSVTVPVHESDDESEKGSARSVRSDHSRHSHLSADSAKISERSKHSIRSEDSQKSPRSDRSIKSDRSNRSGNSKSSVKSAKSDRSKDSPRSDKSDDRVPSPKSTRSKRSSVGSIHTEKSDEGEGNGFTPAPKKDDDNVSVKSDRSAKSVNSASSESTVKSHGSKKSAASSVGSGSTAKSVSSDKPAVQPAPQKKSIEDNAFYTISTALAMDCSSRDGDNITVNGKTGSLSDLVEILAQAKDLMKLCMPSCNITDGEVSQIITSLINSKCQLMELDLSGNPLGLQGGLSVISVVQSKSTSLRSIKLNDTKVTTIVTAELVKKLQIYKVNLSSLWLDNCLEDGETYSMKDLALSLCGLIQRPGSKLRNLSVSHLNTTMVELVCTGITEAEATMAQVAFHKIQGITEFAGISPIRLNAKSTITTLSLANNDLNDAVMEKILDYWRKNEPNITNVILRPGNEELSDRYLKKVQYWSEGREEEADESAQEEEAESDNGGGNTSSSESDTTGDESTAQSKASTTVVGKPPLPPNRMASRQDSAVSSSETETETETEKSESEQSEKEKAAKPAQPTVQQKTVEEPKKPSGEAETSSSEEETETEDETETESQKKDKSKVTLATSSESGDSSTPRSDTTTPRATTPLSSKPKTGQEITDDVTDIVPISSTGKSLEELVTGRAEIKLSNLDEDQVDELVILLRNHQDVRVLKLMDTSLNDVLLGLSDALKGQKYLQELVLANCSLESGNCANIAKIVKKHTKTLQVLSLRGNNLGDSGAASIIKEVSDVATDAYNSRLQRQAKDLVSKSLTDAMKSDSMVSIVTEGSDDVKGSDSSPLPPVSPPALETLILSDCRIGNATTEQVIKLLQGDALKDLRLAYNPDITQFGWKDILNTVSQKQASLSQLDISSNALGRFGVAHGSPLMSLAGAKLDFLNLSGEQLVDDNVEVFSSALRDRQTKVPVIKLEPGNNLTDESISTLQSAAYT